VLFRSRAIPRKYYDPQRHTFRVESLSNTLACLQKIDELRERYLPKLKIIFTISPVRLKATFRPVSAFTANSVSKAILRAALDEFLRSKWDLVNKTYYYFPSYEMVCDVIKEPFEADNRHVYAHVPQQILSVFSRYYTTHDSNLENDSDVFETAENRELYGLIRQLEGRNGDLQRECDNRLAVINQLQEIANDRLNLINDLNKTAEERLNVIRLLDAETKRLQRKGFRIWGR
jgi:hypothetical protein